MVPELRLVRYFLAVAQERNITRAAERLHLAQPSLSAAVKQLEEQLGVPLLERSGRGIALTPAGELLARRGAELTELAETVAAEVRERGSLPAGRLRLGLSPTARYGVGPRLLAAWASAAPGVMLYTQEDTTGALLRDLAAGRLDLAVLFCPPDGLPAGIVSVLIADEPAVVHLPSSHPLAGRDTVSPEDLRDETILVASTQESGGFTARVRAALADVAPATRPDPYPDLGLQAVREGLGVVVYVRSAFPEALPGSAFVPLDPPLTLPFHLAWRDGSRPAALQALLDATATVLPPRSTM